MLSLPPFLFSFPLGQGSMSFFALPQFPLGYTFIRARAFSQCGTLHSLSEVCNALLVSLIVIIPSVSLTRRVWLPYASMSPVYSAFYNSPVERQGYTA